MKKVKGEKVKTTYILIRKPEDFMNISADFRNLWEICFAFCSSLPKDLEALSSFACLGFLDISFTNINLKQIQTVFSKLNIIKLNCVGCPNLAENEFSIRRGFLIEILPLTWTLNEMYITYAERQHWKKYFSSSDGGAYSAIWAKWKMELPDYFIPHSPTIWSDNAKIWLSYPNCKMGADLDKWKIDILMMDFQKTLTKSNLYPSHNLNPKNSSVLLVLIIASFFPSFPKFLLHDILKHVFSQNQHWSDFEECPLNMNIKDRIFYLGILCAHLKMSLLSSVSKKALFDEEWLFHFYPKLMHICVKSMYPSPGSLDSLDFIGYRANSLEITHTIISENLQIEAIEMSKLHLLILELLCATSHERLFLAHANTFRKLAMIHSCSVLKSDFSFDDQDDDWEHVTEGMTVASRAVEVKLKLILLIRRVLERVEEVDSFARNNNKSKMEDSASAYVIRPNFKQK